MGMYGRSNYQRFFYELEDCDKRARIAQTGCKVLIAFSAYSALIWTIALLLG
jgi:hypothetical protein